MRTTLEIVYYRQGSREPVAEYVEALARQCPAAGARLADHLDVWVVEGPMSQALDCRHMGQGLWELKVRSVAGQHRVFFGVDAGVLWLLHAMTKKSARTPQRDLDLARRRWRNVTR